MRMRSALLASSLSAAGCNALLNLDGLSGGAPAGSGQAADDTGSNRAPSANDAADDFCPNSSSLVACMRFDAPEVIDESPHRQPVELQSLSFVPGRTGSALRFTSSPPSLLRLPAAVIWDSERYTFEAWIRVSALVTTGRAGIIDVVPRFSIFLYPDGVHCRSASDPINDAIYAVPVARWFHLACVWEPESVRLFVDGVLRSDVKGTWRPDRSGTSTVFIGANAPDGLENFDGDIDGLRVWNTARPPEEIQSAAR